MKKRKKDYNSIFSILAKMLDALAEEESLEVIEKKMRLKKEINKSLLNTAYSWFYEKLNANKIKNDKKIQSLSIRYLSEEEIDLIGIENNNRILKLYNIGLLTNSDIDLIVNQIHLYPYDQMTKDEMNILVLSSLFFMENLPFPELGNSFQLSEKIN